MAAEKHLPEIEPGEAKRLADAVRKIEKAVTELAGGGLNRKALVILLAESTGVPRRDINAVLDGLESLGKDYLEKTK